MTEENKFLEALLEETKTLVINLKELRENLDSMTAMVNTRIDEINQKDHE